MKSMKSIRSLFIGKIPILTLLFFISSITFTSCFAKSGVEDNAPAKQEQSDASSETKIIEKPAEVKEIKKESQKLTEIFDGRTERKEKTASDAETKMVSAEYKSNEATIVEKSKFECDEGTEEGVSIVGVAEGSFTKAKSSQKAYLYERCRAGRSFGIGGLIIYEGETVVSHYIYGENGLESGIFSTTDINKNGLTEIVLVAFGTGQGYSEGSIVLFEMNNGNLDYLGRTETYSDNSGAVSDEAKIETTAYKISVEPSANPIFYRETYSKKGNAKDWSLTKKSEKVSLDKKDAPAFIKIK